jgi:guanylate kinase
VSERPRGIPIVVSGPSGVGKTSVLKRLLASDPNLRFSVSHTTRRPREGEVHGRDYFFVERDAFRNLIDANGFLEWAEYQGNLYGTSLAAVEGPSREGFDLLLEVEVQGAEQLRKRLPEAVTVFILPPSVNDLEVRLHGRGSDEKAAIQKRLEIARAELAEAGKYHFVIVNEDLATCVSDLKKIVETQRLTPGRVLPEWKARTELA